MGVLSSDLTTLWAWAALLLAAVAAFTGLISRSDFLIPSCRKGRPVLPHPSFQYYDDEDDCCSSSSSDEEDDDEEEDTDDDDDDAVSSCSENCGEERPFFWPEIGGAVVKAWDGLGVGLGRAGSGSINLFDLSRGEILRSFANVAAAGKAHAFDFASPAVILSAAVGEASGSSPVKVWDARGGEEAPVVTGEYWRPIPRRRAVGVAGGEEGRVYVTDDAGDVAEVDLRGGSPQAEMTTWWDAGDTLAAEEDQGGWGRSRRRGGSVVSWCRDAAKCLTLLPLAE